MTRLDTWLPVAQVNLESTDEAPPILGTISVRGSVMRFTTVRRVGNAGVEMHKYAPLWGWNGTWMTLAAAERAGRTEGQVVAETRGAA